MKIDTEVSTKTSTTITLTGEDIRALLVIAEVIDEGVPVEVSFAGSRVDVSDPVIVKFEETKYS